MFQAMDIDFKRVEVSITSIPGKEVGRNDPCPCGSGKKYKKCCLNKQTILNSPSIKDYGMAHLSDTFFEANPFEEISAARITYSCILNSGIEQTAARKAMSSVPRERWKKENTSSNTSSYLRLSRKIHRYSYRTHSWQFPSLALASASKNHSSSHKS